LRFDGIGGAEVGFGLPGIEVVYWRAQVGNWASRRVAGRCGFRMEGTVRGLLEQRGERRDEPLTGQPDRSPHGD
jgi:RimJ/RimL family protein N-acetyltransferase